MKITTPPESLCRRLYGEKDGEGSSPFAAETGVDAGTYTVSEPLTVAVVRERVAAFREHGDGEVRNIDKVELYRDVLNTIAADRGPLGDLARAALEAEGG